jgi:hypothetical protein
MLKDKDPVLDTGATLVISWAGHKGHVFKAKLHQEFKGSNRNINLSLNLVISEE